MGFHFWRKRRRIERYDAIIVYDGHAQQKLVTPQILGDTKAPNQNSHTKPLNSTTNTPFPTLQTTNPPPQAKASKIPAVNTPI
ncbi:MAG TPA: hypothetical protein ENK85_02750 [Saprospiraceae bacterium]|nr:hypothetical protein [Saprospiraceae bacterium]